MNELITGLTELLTVGEKYGSSFLLFVIMVAGGIAFYRLLQRGIDWFITVWYPEQVKMSNRQAEVLEAIVRRMAGLEDELSGRMGRLEETVHDLTRHMFEEPIRGETNGTVRETQKRKVAGTNIHR